MMIQEIDDYVCEYEIVECSNQSRESTERYHLESHLRNLCCLREYICPYYEVKRACESPGVVVTCPNKE